MPRRLKRLGRAGDRPKSGTSAAAGRLRRTSANQPNGLNQTKGGIPPNVDAPPLMKGNRRERDGGRADGPPFKTSRHGQTRPKGVNQTQTQCLKRSARGTVEAQAYLPI